MVLVSFRYSYGEFQSVKSQVRGTGICTYLYSSLLVLRNWNILATAQ